MRRRGSGTDRLVGVFFFFFQAEDGIRDLTVTGVQTCALPILMHGAAWAHTALFTAVTLLLLLVGFFQVRGSLTSLNRLRARLADVRDGRDVRVKIGRASCRERV